MGYHKIYGYGGCEEGEEGGYDEAKFMEGKVVIVCFLIHCQPVSISACSVEAFSIYPAHLLVSYCIAPSWKDSSLSLSLPCACPFIGMSVQLKVLRAHSEAQPPRRAYWRLGFRRLKV